MIRLPTSVYISPTRGGFGAPGKINLYVGHEPVRFNIPEAEAVESLVDLIREHDKWVESSESVGA